MAYGMAIASENVTAEIVDWEDFRNLGRELRVSTVPKTFINRDNPFAGTLPEAAILEKVIAGQ